METGFVHLHNLLRWVIVVMMAIVLFQAFAKKSGITKTSLILMIAAHLTLLLGLYQWIAGRYGLLKGLPEGVVLMKDTFYRFYWVEHPVSMLLVVVLITLARRRAKTLQYKATGILLLIAAILLVAAVPWPFRGELIGRGIFPGM